MAFDVTINEQNGGGENYANDILYYNSGISYGPILLETIQSDAMEIEGNVNKEDLIPIYYQYSINNVEKYIWNTQDGFFYSTPNIKHSFVASGTYTIALTVISEEQFYNGIPFRFKYTHTQNTIVKSFFYKLILKNLPMFQYNVNQETQDLITASANFFDKLYTDIKNVYSLIDIENIEPRYFEYMASTLGHNQEYIKKVGGNANDDTFEQYNIFERIKNNIATPSEIRQFRQFLLLSVDIFKTGGTPNQVKQFLSFFSIDAKAIDLWTQYWGLKAKGLTNEKFVGYDNFEDNSLKLKWQETRVVGNSNDQGHLIKNFNSIIIDNYHTVQKIEYAIDAVDEDATYTYFRVYNTSPIFKDIRRENGNLIVGEDVTSDYYDFVENPDTDSAKVYPWLIKIKTEYLEDGDRLSINYETTPIESIDSVVASTDTTIKNADYEVKFKYLPIYQPYENTNVKIQDNEIFFVLRGILTDDETYDNFNEYYRVSLNAKRSTVSLAKVIKNSTNEELITQKINLNQADEANKIFEKLILNTDNEVVQFKFNVAYDLKVSIIDSTISAYYKESTEFNEITKKIEANEGEVPFGETLSTWIPLFENVNIDVKEVDTFSTDNTEEEIPAYPYSPILVGGQYGVGARNSIIEILEMTIDNFDFEDSLYNDEEKELNLKPKYLEWQNSKLLTFNSYSDNKTNNFGKIISSPFDPSVKQYNLQPNESKAFSYLYFDNAPVSEEVASRYTVSFDKTWINNNFKNEQEVMDKIIVPFGSQSSWFSIESRIYDTDFYKNYFGDSDTSKNFGTTGSPDIHTVPGYFSYNLCTTLDTYRTEPDDAFSSVTRIDTKNVNGVILKSSFQANSRISEYKYSNNPIRMRGLFEEVCPDSGIFSSASLCGKIENDDQESINPLLLPIVFNTTSVQRLVGVRFRNCSDIKNIISRIKNGRDENIEVQLYGLFTLQIPLESIKFRPNKLIDLQASPNDENTVLVKMFVPLGILNGEIQNYSLSTEYMHDVENSGATCITLNSVYTRVPREIMVYKEQENTFDLPSLNPYEDAYLGKFCKYYLSADLTLATNLNDYEKTIGSISTKYMMNYDFRKLLDGLIKNKADFNNSYLWWIPKQLWRKRDFEILNLDTENDIATGLNYDSSSDKYFYGKKTPKNSKLNSLRIKIKDGAINPYTTYYAKIRFRMSWSGFDELILGNASLVDGSVKPARPLSATEAAALTTVGGKHKKYLNSVPAPVGECIEFYVPISWYPKDELSSDNIIQWGNYIKGVNGKTNAPSVSLTPYGLMSYLILHATNANYNSEDIAKVTSGWTVSDWNDRFMSFINIDFIAEEIPQEVYSLYGEYGFVSKYASVNGATVNIDYDAGSIPEWKVIDTISILPKSYDSYYFTIPTRLYRLYNWVEDITGITVDNYIVPFDLYSLNNDIITLNSDNIFNVLVGGDLKARFSFDILFEDNKKNITFVDDFYNTRDIKWIEYQENHTKDVFELAIRNANEDLFLTGNAPLIKIDSYNGTNVMKINQGSTTNVYDPLLSGISNNVNSVVVSKDENGGYTKTLSLIEEQNDVYQLETLVLFDNILNTTKGYNGKKFEFIIKADTKFNPNTNTFILSSYYFVGIGTYNFDIALGVAKYNPDTGKMEKTFLAGFGDYNTNNIKSNTWYKLKVLVDSDYIKVIFNEEKNLERMVINYNININYQKDINRYLSGEFEELVYLVTGLDKLKITYPDNLKSIAGDSFYNNNWNETWAANNRPIGPYSGIKIFNPYTYVKKASYVARIQGDTTFNNSNELTDLNGIILEIENNYDVSGVIDFVGKTANGGIIVKYGSDLFSKIADRFVSKVFTNVSKVYISGNKIVVRFNDKNKLTLAICDEKFVNTQTVYVKDNFFNSDHIYKYMLWTERDIDEVYANPNRLYVTFKDI
jgi:hypothetical protein